MNLSKEIASMYDDAVRIRQDLHRIPEIGFQLHDTQAYVLNELRRCAPDRLETLAVCGVKAVFFAKDAQKTNALRADMDGIHNDEANDVPYRSQRPGCMHGCGHDGHMTILLLLARWIARNRARLHCNVVLLFQPGEEGWAGARRMIDDGALENPRVDCICGRPCRRAGSASAGTISWRRRAILRSPSTARARTRPRRRWALTPSSSRRS